MMQRLAALLLPAAALWAGVASAEQQHLAQPSPEQHLAQPSPDWLPDDDLCSSGEEDEGGECSFSLSLRQLRGEVRRRKSEAEEAEAQAGRPLDVEADRARELLAGADASGDGEVQHGEAVDFVGGLAEHGPEESLALFQMHDADSSKGLNSQEFAKALEAWGYHGGGYHYHGPYGGHGGGYHYGGHGPYGGYHSGGGYHVHGPYGGVHGGGYHHGPYGGGHYHYHGYR